METNYKRMIALAESLAADARAIVARHRLPWHIAQSGARVETMWTARPPVNASEVAKSRDGALEAQLHTELARRREQLVAVLGEQLLVGSDHVAAGPHRLKHVVVGRLAGSRAGRAEPGRS